MKNFSKTNAGEGARTELHDTLGLTGAEISINHLPAGASVPFFHSHKQNEEVYAVLAGAGKAIIDSEEVALKAGDWLRIAPAARRRFFAGDATPISFICIQTKAGSLENYTATDAII